MSTETEKISKLDLKSGKNKTTKEKYDSFWNKIFYFCLGICAFGIILMVINVNEFRKKLMALNPNYRLPQYTDFWICIPLMGLISLVKVYSKPFLTRICEKIMKKSYRFPKNEKDRELYILKAREDSLLNVQSQSNAYKEYEDCNTYLKKQQKPMMPKSLH